MKFYSPIRSNNSPPDAYSRKMYSTVPCVLFPKNFRMFGCDRIFWMHTSFFTEASASGCFFRSTIFIATASPDSRLMRSLTLEGHEMKNFTNLEENCSLNYLLTRHKHPRRVSEQDSNFPRILCSCSALPFLKLFLLSLREFSIHFTSPPLKLSVSVLVFCHFYILRNMPKAT